MGLISKHGEMWSRNLKNIGAIPGSSQGGQGIYILFDGSTPVYIGEGNIRQRIRKARTSKRRGQSWDHFSWYVVRDAAHRQELEALLLRMLPSYLRILTRQRGRLPRSRKQTQADHIPEHIARPHTFGRSR